MGRDIKSSNIMLTRAQGHRIIKVRLCNPLCFCDSQHAYIFPSTTINFIQLLSRLGDTLLCRWETSVVPGLQPLKATTGLSRGRPPPLQTGDGYHPTIH